MIPIQYDGVDVKLFVNQLDKNNAIMEHVYELINAPGFSGKMRFMPDVHANPGSMVVGFTMPVAQKPLRLAPGCIGTDIGCGVTTACFGEINRDWGAVADRISKTVPSGVGKRTDKMRYSLKHDFPWGQARTDLHQLGETLGRPLSDKKLGEFGGYSHDYFKKLARRTNMEYERITHQFGTLGGGNHFLELASDPDGAIWCTIHSGSRGVGYMAAKYWIEKAKNKRKKDSATNVENRPDHLIYLEDNELDGYLVDLNLLQHYARQNRRTMLKQVQAALEAESEKIIDATHNYVDFQDGIVRKGAASARDGQLVPVPINMAEGTLLVEGKGNMDWNQSVCHGAGRVLGRKEAKKKIDKSDVEQAMQDVEIAGCAPRDEAPDAYKTKKQIESAIGPTAAIKNRLNNVLVSLKR